MESLVYMDHNATTQVRPEVRDAIAGTLALTGNASSVHGQGRAVRRVIEDARDRVADLAGADPAAVVFTSGGTEANNLAIRGTGRARVLASAVEHVSVLKAVPDIEEIPVDGNGIVDVGALQAMLKGDEGPVLVSVMLANNETGAIQPVAEVSEIAHELGAIVHCDAVQAAGKITVDIGTLGVDMMSLSAHKMGGPQGTGALVVVGDTPIDASFRGGGQERGRRAGTENVPGIAGFGAAARMAKDQLSEFAALGAWRDGIEALIVDRAAVRIFGHDAPRLANTSCLTMPGVTAEQQIIALDLLGVAVSAGSACSSGKVEPSHVLAAMGADADDAATAIRVSLGWNTTEKDVGCFVDAWAAVYEQMGDKSKTAAGMAA